MRQDVEFRPGEAVSQQVIARLLGGRVDEILTLEPHLHRIAELETVFPCRARALGSAELLADWCRSGTLPAFLVGPDAESEAWVRKLADVAGLPWIVCEKYRRGDADVVVTVPKQRGRGRAILVDDIASSGMTLAAAATALFEAGVDEVDAAVVHAIFASGAIDCIRSAGIRAIVSTDSIPHASNGIPTARFFAAALARDVWRSRNRGASCSD
jgi:ribose-phosphate pyrophosphokinase